MRATSQLILPPATLASCLAGCVVRDTRAVKLSDADRVNYFPATPLFTATVILSGQLHTADGILPVAALRARPAAPETLFQPPRSRPQMSWSPGPIFALTVAFFPDAWLRLGGALDGTPSDSIQQAISLLKHDPLDAAWPEFWQEIATMRANSTNSGLPADWAGSDRVKDWTFHVMGQLAQSSSGRGLRSAQRRLKRWTGLNMQTLAFFAKVEDAHQLISKEPSASPAEVAADAGFADQSHMGRALKRATGFSPMNLNQKIANEEPFWCYRLLGERF